MGTVQQNTLSHMCLPNAFPKQAAPLCSAMHGSTVAGTDLWAAGPGHCAVQPHSPSANVGKVKAVEDKAFSQEVRLLAW